MPQSLRDTNASVKLSQLANLLWRFTQQDYKIKAWTFPMLLVIYMVWEQINKTKRSIGSKMFNHLMDYLLTVTSIVSAMLFRNKKSIRFDSSPVKSEDSKAYNKSNSKNRVTAESTKKKMSSENEYNKIYRANLSYKKSIDDEKSSMVLRKKAFADERQLTYGVDERDMKGPDNWVKRNPDMLRLTGLHPFNAEAPLNQLMDSGFITPVSLHYTRNHGAVPKELKWETHEIEFSGEGIETKSLKMQYIYDTFEHQTFPVTLCCAGNRRKEENMRKKGMGFSWNTTAHSTSVWSGVMLRDVLLHIGVPWATHGNRADTEERYVWFTGPEGELPHGNYGTSVPLGHVMNEANDVMLAFGQNGKRLHPDRGFPIRVIIPGWIGGRMVKWLHKVEVRTEPTDSWYHYHDNRIMPAIVDKQLADDEGWWFKEEYLFNQLNINSAISSPAHGDVFSPTSAGATKIEFKGYAYCGAGHKITRVEITTDNGKTWKVANLVIHERPNRYKKYWCWVFWSVDLDVMQLIMSGTKEIAVRAWNEVNNTQPNDLTWNLLGMGNNSWFRVKMTPVMTQDKSIGLSFTHPTQGSGMTNTGWMIPPGEISPGLASIKGPKSEKDGNLISWSEIKKHNNEDDAWIVIDGKVYDCTPFLEEHPGGASSIFMNAGEDCTEDFTAIHSQKAWTQLKTYQIGIVQVSEHTKSDPVRQQEEAKIESILNPKLWIDFVLKSKVEVSHDTILIQFSPTNPAENNKYLGLPTGNHIMVKANDGEGKSIIRPYTPIFATEKAKEDFSLLIKVYNKCQQFPKGGKMSQILDRYEIGQTIKVKGPSAHITYLGTGVIQSGKKIHKIKKIGFLCGGTGITPAFSIIEAILGNIDDPTEIFLIYANRTPADILLRKELDDFVQKYPKRIHVWYTVEDALEEDWKYSVGWVDLAMVKEHIPSGDAGDCFIGNCGPPPMIKYACIPNLLKHGYNKGDNGMFGNF